MSSENAVPATRGRWKIALAGVAIQMMLGTVYAWSVFKAEFLKNPAGWQEWQVGLTFALTIFFLGFSAAIGGRLVDKAGTRTVASVAAILFGLGTFLAGLADQTNSLWLLWIGYGVIAGIGNGLGYVTPVAVLVRWFPDKKGLITGLAVMGFGLGAALMTVVSKYWAISAFGLANTFYGAGILFLVGLLLAAQKLVNPPADYMSAAKKAAAPVVAVEPAAARKMYQFYVLWGILFLNVTAGIAIVSNHSPMAKLLPGVTAGMADAVVIAGSFCNGFGRLFWGGLSEKIGRKGVFLLIFGTQIPLFILLPYVTNLWLFAAISCYILLCYGGGFGTMPSFAADTFGAKHIGSIYGMILFAWGLAGAAGPTLMEWVKKTTGGFAGAMGIAAGILTCGFVLTLLYKKPQSSHV